jgi:hypothetical protein
MVIVSDRVLKFFGLFFGGSDGIRGLAFWPFIFISSKTIIDDELINHERIHLRQQLEMLIIPFYIWYLIELYTKGYMNISFEKEAYANEKNLTYLKKRRIFAFRKFLK